MTEFRPTIWESLLERHLRNDAYRQGYSDGQSRFRRNPGDFEGEQIHEYDNGFLDGKERNKFGTSRKYPWVSA